MTPPFVLGRSILVPSEDIFHPALLTPVLGEPSKSKANENS